MSKRSTYWCVHNYTKGPYASRVLFNGSVFSIEAYEVGRLAATRMTIATGVSSILSAYTIAMDALDVHRWDCLLRL